MTSAALGSLFLAAFLAATVVPFSSEVAVVGAMAAGISPLAIITVASVGNTAGAALNWLLGCGIEQFRDRRWFPVNTHELERAQRWFQRYGVWSLLFAWLPLVGDALTVVAGVMRIRFVVFLVLTAIGKTARYVVLVMLLDAIPT